MEAPAPHTLKRVFLNHWPALRQQLMAKFTVTHPDPHPPYVHQVLTLHSTAQTWLIRVSDQSVSLNYGAPFEEVSRALDHLHHVLHMLERMWPEKVRNLLLRALALGWQAEPLYYTPNPAPKHVGGILITPVEDGVVYSNEAGAFDENGHLIAGEGREGSCIRYTASGKIAGRSLNRHDLKKLMAVDLKKINS